jgi:hypothetical protein
MLLTSFCQEAILDRRKLSVVSDREESSWADFRTFAPASEADVIWLELSDLGEELIQGVVGVCSDDDRRITLAHLRQEQAENSDRDKRLARAWGSLNNCQLFGQHMSHCILLVDVQVTQWGRWQALDHIDRPFTLRNTWSKGAEVHDRIGRNVLWDINLFLQATDMIA